MAESESMKAFLSAVACSRVIAFRIVWPVHRRLMKDVQHVLMRGAIVVTAALILFAGCAPNENKRRAETAVAEFHEALNKAKYHEIYMAADPEFRKGTSEADAVAYLGAINAKLGLAQNAQLKDWRVDISLNRTLVVLSYETEFTQGRAAEDFIWSTNDNRANLFRYNISSPTLVTK